MKNKDCSESLMEATTSSNKAWSISVMKREGLTRRKATFS